MRVEPSLWQRAYLLWTFRNFRRLSVALLNARQHALVNALFCDSAEALSRSPDRSLAIGVVENFVPPTPPKRTFPAPKEEQREPVASPRAEIAAVSKPGSSSSPAIAWSKLGTALAALSLCVISALAWHRIQGVPSTQAQNQPQLQPIRAAALPSSLRSGKPAVTEDPAALAPTAATAQPVAVLKGALKPPSIASVTSPPKQALHIHTPASIPSPTPSDQDSLIQASRPPLRFAYPVYTDVRTRGAVALTARVDSDGTVRAVRVVSGNRALAAAAVRAVRQWRYRSYFRDGQPVATETNIVISFISDDAISMSFPQSLPASQLAETQPAKHNLSEKLKMR